MRPHADNKHSIHSELKENNSIEWTDADCYHHARTFPPSFGDLSLDRLKSTKPKISFMASVRRCQGSSSDPCTSNLEQSGTIVRTPAMQRGGPSNIIMSCSSSAESGQNVIKVSSWLPSAFASRPTRFSCTYLPDGGSQSFEPLKYNSATVSRKRY